ncbi:hypothetical protein L7F22_046555 [Adiantum nelumboides]|nr:hypothetical protein [Adiantum nelumboides]
MHWAAKCREKRTIADYSHRRPKMQQKKEHPDPRHKIDRHRQHYYYGLHTTNVTQHLGCAPPSHSYSPALIHAAPPSYHRKSSSITENVLGAVHVKRFDPSLPAPWYNRQATDVTEQLRFVPPTHATGSSKPDPWYGRARTYVTNPDVDDYSMYQVNRDSALKEEEVGQHEGQVDQQHEKNAGERGGSKTCYTEEDLDNCEKEEKEWGWNDEHKLTYPANGSAPYSACHHQLAEDKEDTYQRRKDNQFNSGSQYSGGGYLCHSQGARRGGRGRGRGGRGRGSCAGNRGSSGNFNNASEGWKDEYGSEPESYDEGIQRGCVRGGRGGRGHAAYICGSRRGGRGARQYNSEEEY